MAKAARASQSLPDEIVFWEILVRLPPKPLQRCRSVCRAWHRVTCKRDFLLAHHARQPNLPIFYNNDRYMVGVRNPKPPEVHYYNILAFDHRAATSGEQLHAIAHLDEAIYLHASCDGLLILSNIATKGSSPCISICNPATREHAPLGLPRDFSTLGMYSHHPTGEFRLLLRRCMVEDPRPEDQIGCYVFTLGSDQPPRYIGWPEMASRLFNLPARVRDSLHWYPVYDPSGTKRPMCENKQLLVFDTIAKLFHEMRTPIVPTGSYIVEMDGMLGIHSRDYAIENIDIWVLQSYESEVWELKHRIKLPVAEIRREFVDHGESWDLDVFSVDGVVLLLVKVDRWLLHIDNDGKLVNRFYCRRRGLCMTECRLKQSLVQHTFFPVLQGYDVNASPLFRPIE